MLATARQRCPPKSGASSARRPARRRPRAAAAATAAFKLAAAMPRCKVPLTTLTPSRPRETRYSTYARSTPPTAQHGPLHTVSDVGMDVHDHRQRCNSEKHPTVSQLFSARSHDPSSCSSRTLSANVTWVCSGRAGHPALASQGQVNGLCRGADHGLEAFRPSLTALGRARGFSRPVCTRRHETAQRPI